MLKLVWQGRLGNNVFQLLHAVAYALVYNHSVIEMPEHPWFLTTSLGVCKPDDSFAVSNVIHNLFQFDRSCQNLITYRYLYDSYNLPNVSFTDLSLLFQHYVRPWFREVPIVKSYDCAIHIRSGDLFQGLHSHGQYVQPPLKQYVQVLQDLRIKPEQAIVVAEDIQNPVILKLLELGLSFQSASIAEDLAVCAQSKHLIAGFGTLAPVAIFLGRHQSVHLPNPFLPERNRSYIERGLPPHIHVYEFQNYITSFHNFPNERQQMLSWNDTILKIT